MEQAATTAQFLRVNRQSESQNPKQTRDLNPHAIDLTPAISSWDSCADLRGQ